MMDGVDSSLGGSTAVVIVAGPGPGGGGGGGGGGGRGRAMSGSAPATPTEVESPCNQSTSGSAEGSAGWSRSSLRGSKCKNN